MGFTVTNIYKLGHLLMLQLATVSWISSNASESISVSFSVSVFDVAHKSTKIRKLCFPFLSCYRFRFSSRGLFSDSQQYYFMIKI